MMTKAHVGHATGNIEWFTPPEYIVAARAVMTDIDLDPATTERANEKYIHADAFYTKETDGLAQEWHGRIWLNPPYSQPLVALFTGKLLEELAALRVTEACVLVNNATETKWFQNLLKNARALCLIKGRVRFLDPAGNLGKPLQGQAVVYLGENPHKFQHVFMHFGEVLHTISWRGYGPDPYPSSPYFAIGGVSIRPMDTGIFGIGQYDEEIRRYEEEEYYE